MAVIEVEPVPAGTALWWLTGVGVVVLAVAGYRAMTTAGRA